MGAFILPLLFLPFPPAIDLVPRRCAPPAPGMRHPGWCHQAVDLCLTQDRPHVSSPLLLVSFDYEPALKRH